MHDHRERFVQQSEKTINTTPVMNKTDKYYVWQGFLERVRKKKYLPKLNIHKPTYTVHCTLNVMCTWETFTIIKRGLMKIRCDLPWHHEWKSKILVLTRRYPCLDCKYIFFRSFYMHIRCEMLIIHFVSDGLCGCMLATNSKARNCLFDKLGCSQIHHSFDETLFYLYTCDLRISDYSAALRCQDKHCQKTCRKWSFVCRLQGVLQSNIPKVPPGFIIPILLTTTSRWLRLKLHHHIQSTLAYPVPFSTCLLSCASRGPDKRRLTVVISKFAWTSGLWHFFSHSTSGSCTPFQSRILQKSSQEKERKTHL